MENSEDIQKAERAEVAAGRAYLANITGSTSGPSTYATWLKAMAATDAARSPLPTLEELLRYQATEGDENLHRAEFWGVYWLRWASQYVAARTSRTTEQYREIFNDFADELEKR